MTACLTAASYSVAAPHVASYSSATIQEPYQLIGSMQTPTPELSKVPWFPELLEYEVSWGIISVGSANLKTSQVEDFNGTPAVRIVSQATSNGFCDAFYKVRDLNESWIQATDFYSLGYSKHLQEGRFFRNEWVLYDYPNKAFLSKTTNKDGSFYYKQGSIPGPVQDILSSMYFLRNKPLHVGDEITLDVNTKDNWPLLVKVPSRRHWIANSGEIDVVVVEPQVRKEGIFIQKGRHMEVWMTDDARHIPVYLSVEVFFGHVSANLVRLNGQPFSDAKSGTPPREPGQPF